VKEKTMSLREEVLKLIDEVEAQRLIRMAEFPNDLKTAFSFLRSDIQGPIVANHPEPEPEAEPETSTADCLRSVDDVMGEKLDVDEVYDTEEGETDGLY
jgi:hypothetical protein